MIMKIIFSIKQLLKMFVQSCVLPFAYNLCRHKPVNKNLIIFADARHDSIPFSMSELYKQTKNMDYEIIDYTHNFSNLSYSRTLWLMIKFMRLYAAAGYVFICDYYLPVASCRKKPETYVVQTWHAGGPMKKFGYDSPEDIPAGYKGNVFKNYSLVTASSSFMVPIMSRNMKQPEGVVQATGISRTDRYFNTVFLKQCRENFYAQHADAIGKKIVMWAPTFRGNAARPYLVGTDVIQQIKSELSEEWYVIIKVHPHIDAIEHLSTSTIPSEDLLPVTDILISDYSSIFYDYITMKKPAVLFVPDSADYQQNRGLYIDYRTLPCPIVDNKADLINAIHHLSSDWDKAGIEQCYKDYMGNCDGNSTKRILDLVFTPKTL